MKLFTTTVSLFAAIFLLTGCGGGSSNHDFTTPIVTPAATPTHGPIFDPAAGKIPTTNDIFFLGSTDGTLNLPNVNALVPQLNTLDGFSTSIPVIAEFGIPIDQATLLVGSTIRIFEVTKNAQGAVTGVVSEITAAEITAVATGAEGATLALVPNAPLKESTSYMVILTNLIKGTDGLPAQSASVYIIAKSKVSLTGSDFEALEPLRQLVNNMEVIAGTQDIAEESIVLSWSFTTQSITPVLNAVATNAKAESLVVVPTGKTTADIIPSSPGIADVYIGTLDIPYYLEAPSEDNPAAPLTGYWKGIGGSSLTRFNPTPVSNTTLTIPVMMTIPNNKMTPQAGWPIVMYQHGITRVRTDMLVYADAMAAAGFAVIAIDLPLHGITDNTNPFHTDNTPFPNDIEPTFELDLVNNDTGEPVPDGKVDSSDSLFLNLRSLLTSRDNVRQGVANLLTLRRSLGSIANVGTDPFSAVAIDTSRVGFVAHSLGGIIAVPYMAVETQSLPTSLVTTGAPISKIIDESGSFGPQIKEGLAAVGITGDALAPFFQGVQWVTDSADPVNFAKAAAAKHPIHMIKVIDDGTMPNSTTDILSALIGAKDVSTTVTDIAPNAAGIVTFTQGAHSSPLDPSEGLDVFLEMHSQMATFQGSGGTTILVSNPGIIQ